MSEQDVLEAVNDVLETAAHTPFYRDRLGPLPLGSMEALRRIPITTKEDLRRHSPYGLLATPEGERCDYYESFGTTGRPVSIWLNREDLLATARQIASSGVHLGPDDLVLIRFPYAMSQIAHVFHHGAHQRGACVIPAGSRSTLSPFRRVAMMMAELGVSVLAGLPFQALMLAETAMLLGMDPRRDFPRLRAICTAGEPLGPPRRALLEDLWGVPIFDIYGMTEIGTAAVDGTCGRMHPITADFVLEVLDDDLATPVAAGEVGQLVVTALRRKATPMVRYLTGDRARLVSSRCDCGASWTLDVRGRSADRVISGERSWDLWELEAMAAWVKGRRLWAAGPLKSGTGVHLIVEAVAVDEAVTQADVDRLSRAEGTDIRIDIVPIGALYDRSLLLEVADIGKPRCVFSAEELDAMSHMNRGNGILTQVRRYECGAHGLV